jgi:chromosome segregation ATPase
MKQYLFTALSLICTVLVVVLILMKHGDDAQHENDAAAIGDFSNQLTSAQAQIAGCNEMILTLSNSLDQSQSATLTFSNQLAEAQANVLLDSDQITNLNRQVAELAQVQSENHTLDRRIMELTNQLTGLDQQLTLTETNLSQANQNYARLENRFRIDVAERLVVERKFRNPSELEAQLHRLQTDPFERQVSEASIYAGLDVEVNSNTVHVITSN